MIEFPATPKSNLITQTSPHRLLNRIFLCVLLLGSLLIAVAPAHALFIKFEGEEVTWSNTKLGGGPAQPTGWVEVNVPAGFTGTILGTEFVSTSGTIYYGTYQTLAWDEQDLDRQRSFVTVENGAFTDIFLFFEDAQTGRVLTLAGPPTGHALMFDTPKPPCTSWTGFEEFDFCGARIAVNFTTSTTTPTLSTDVNIPQTPAPVSGGLHVDGLDGYFEFTQNGGLTFSEWKYRGLNSSGPFFMKQVINWSWDEVNVPNPFAQRFWIRHEAVDHTGSGETIEGDPFEVPDTSVWSLSGQTSTWLDTRIATLEAVTDFCAFVAASQIGVCDVNVGWFLTSGDVGIGVHTIPPEFLGELLGFDFSFIYDIAWANSTFTGAITNKVLTVPVLEE